tara:strand:+ start:10126 stop:10512 length:387 start_codon:yes stop_codon:yes gene_type:complete
MALTGKKYTRVFSTGGSDSDNVSTDLKDKFKADFDNNDYLNLPNMNATLSPVLHILQQLTEELDYLRTEISSNKDHKITVGSNTTLSFGEMTETLVKGKPAYSIVLTVTRDFGGKTGVVTKTSTITLT